MIDLQTLHQAGAEVAGEHGSAWCRVAAVRNDRMGIIAVISDLRQRLGRMVTPKDLPIIVPISVEAMGTIPEAPEPEKPRAGCERKSLFALADEQLQEARRRLDQEKRRADKAERELSYALTGRNEYKERFSHVVAQLEEERRKPKMYRGSGLRYLALPPTIEPEQVKVLMALIVGWMRKAG